MNLEEDKKERLARFPLGAEVTLEDLEQDVHAVNHRLREREPVSWIPVWDAWLITQHDLTIQVMRDAVTYTVDHPGFSTAQVVGPSMLSLDGKTHMRHRRPFERPFRKQEVETRFNQRVADVIDDLLNRLAPLGQAELRRAFAGPIAVEAMITALGLDGVAVSSVLAWYDTIVDAVTRVAAGEPVSAEGRKAYATLGEHLMPSLQSDPNSSLLAMAGSEADGLSQEEIISNAAVLLFGGIETTEGMIANAFYHLLSNRDQLERVQRDFDLMPTVIEESLRMEPAASVVDRYATADVELAGAQIKAGDLVRVSLAGANRDPRVFAEPDRFDLSRSNLRSHVTFAQGPHVCLGLHLARLEAQKGLLEGIIRLPNLRLADSDDADGVPTGQIFRKPKALNVVWGH